MDEFDLQKILNPNIVKKHLLLASLYLTGFEMLRSSIIDDVKGFFCTGFDENGMLFSKDYELRVLSKAEHKFEAHCLWLAECNAITQEDIAQIQNIREHRNKIAHDLPTLLVDPKYSIDVSLMRKMKYYIDSIGRFFGSIEVDTDPDINSFEVDYSQIKSGRQILFDHLISIVDSENI